MTFLTGLLCGIVVVIIAALAVKRLSLSILTDRIAGKHAPLLAWRIMSERQLDLLMRETLQTLPVTPSRRDIRKVVEIVRTRKAAHIRRYEAMENVEEISAFMAEHDLAHHTTDIIAAADPTPYILTSDKSADYHPFTAPEAAVRLPGEFEPIKAVLLTWPTQFPVRWPHHAALAAQISKVVEAHIIVHTKGWAAAVMAFLEKAGADMTRIRFICAPNDDLWIRDYGPTLVQTARGPAFIANPYIPNGLGYHRRDNELPVEIARVYGLPVHRLPIVLEGGNLISDGTGGIYMAHSVFDHNPDIDEAELRRIMKAYYGAERLTLLPPMPLENTGHIDIALKLASPTAAWVTQSDKSHPWHDTLEEIAAIMSRTHQLLRLPIAPGKEKISESCPANALTVNGTIFYPSYDPVTDKIAAEIFQQLAPKISLQTVDYRDFTVGALHCQTKEIAALY